MPGTCSPTNGTSTATASTDDSTEDRPSHTYTAEGSHTVTLRVTDTAGATATDTVTVEVTSRPEVSIDTPAAGTTWKVGDADLLQRLGHRCGGRPAAGLGARLVRDPAPLRPGGRAVPRARAGQLRRRRRRQRHRPDHAAPGDIEIRADGNRLERPDGRRDTARSLPRTDRHDARRQPGRREPGLERGRADRSLHAPGGGRLDEHARGAVASRRSTTRRAGSRRGRTGSRRRTPSSHPRRPVPSRPHTRPLTPGTQTLAFPVEIDSYVDSSVAIGQLRLRRQR